MFVLVCWVVSFVVGCHLLVGWSRLFFFLGRATGRRDFVVGQALVLLWGGLVSSVLVPFGAVFYGGVWWVDVVGVVMLVFVLVAWVRWLRMDRGRYVLKVVLGDDFVEGMEFGVDLGADEVVALGRRKRMSMMFDEFMSMQRRRYNLESEIE